VGGAERSERGRGVGKRSVAALIVLGALAGLLLALLLLQPGEQGYENVERITWVDWRGRTRTIEIHRRVERVR
jgi:hypothetical protein